MELTATAAIWMRKGITRRLQLVPSGTRMLQNPAQENPHFDKMIPITDNKNIYT